MNLVSEVKYRLYLYENYKKELGDLSFYKIFISKEGVSSDILVSKLRKNGVDVDDYKEKALSYCSIRVIELNDISSDIHLNFLLDSKKDSSLDDFISQVESNKYVATLLSDDIVSGFREDDKTDIWCQISTKDLLNRGIPVVKAYLDDIFPILVTSDIPKDLVKVIK